MGVHCSYRERVAEEASRDVIAWYKCAWLSKNIGRSFEAIITTVTHFGLFVSLDHVMIDGMVHIKSLGREYFDYDEAGLKLVGSSSGTIYKSGQTVKVRLIHVDIISQHIDCELIH